MTAKNNHAAKNNHCTLEGTAERKATANARQKQQQHQTARQQLWQSFRCGDPAIKNTGILHCVQDDGENNHTAKQPHGPGWNG
jgi:hypothetical protein